MRPFPRLPDWVQLEHEVAKILTEQEIHGWYFDEVAAWKLASTLRQELSDTQEILRRKYPFVGGEVFTPKRNNGPAGYVEGAPFTRLKEMNPSSRDHIAWILKEHYKWEPKQFTPTGKPLIDEVVLKDIGSETAMEFLKCLTVTKMLGTLSEGVNAWLKLCTKSKRVHHHCSTATNTFRCAHRNPNLGQTPSDNRFRQLFKASPGQIMVGADLSGIELRLFAHYLAPFDGGRYAEILLNGDIHQVNADKIGISRRAVKTVTYAFLYGAGDAKLGKSYDDQLSEQQAKKKGQEIRRAYMDAVPGLERLVNEVKSKSERGYLKLCDRRHCVVDGRHKALNYLLQGSAAVLAKRWLYINHLQTIEQGLCCSQLAFIHDELQFECHPEHADALSASLVSSAAKAGEYYKLNIPIAAEAKQGGDWSEVH